MLKKIIQIVKGGGKVASPKLSKALKRVEVPVDTHGVNRDLIDPRAIETVETLQDAGFETYIVGGAVRDLLLGLHPKDFDIATSATPEEVKRLFRRAFIIGRRFRIVHVIFGGGRNHEVFEVSTFRANVDAADATQVKGSEKSKSKLEGLTHAVDSSGRVLRDNVWGDIASDAARRDFTVNAMYYDPSSEVLVDYHGGMADAKKRIIRMIGEPAERYREDPVRIIRAVRFSAKLAQLGFKLEPKTLEPIPKLKQLLSDVPPSRMFDEMLKLVQTGHSLASIQTLKGLGLERGIYPLLDVIVERADTPMVKRMLADTDERVKAGKPVAPSYLLACVLWQDVIDGWTARREGKKPFAKIPTFSALAQSVDAVFDERIGDVSGRGKLGADMREIWMMQPRFEKRVGGSPHTLVAHLRFRAGFDFLRLRGQCGAEFGEANAAEIAELADWWQDFQDADHQERLAMIEEVKRQPKAPSATGVKSAKPRRTRKPKSSQSHGDGLSSAGV
ncbi:MAG: polynucleotide adenylyltransferase PcnB [Cytophagales bacterium]|nr:polynucleotide adenylyltransferase PcnB [Cytophagales bacterium]